MILFPLYSPIGRSVSVCRVCGHYDDTLIYDISCFVVVEVVVVVVQYIVADAFVLAGSLILLYVCQNLYPLWYKMFVYVLSNKR